MKRTHPELHGFGDQKVYRRAYWQKRGQENMAASLTWGGGKRRRETRPDLATIHGTRRHVIRNQERAERFMAQGLTCRGTPRKRKPANPLFELWKTERASMGKIEIPEVPGHTPLRSLLPSQPLSSVTEPRKSSVSGIFIGIYTETVCVNR
jgi:hypothetical protein